MERESGVDDATWPGQPPGRQRSRYGARARVAGAMSIVLLLSLSLGGCISRVLAPPHVPVQVAAAGTATATRTPTPTAGTIALADATVAAGEPVGGATAAATATELPLVGGYWLPPISSDAPPAPAGTDPAQYMREYGFDTPHPQGTGLSAAEAQRLAVMLPFALAAAARWDARHGSGVEPQLLLFWTHAEGIGGRVSYSNCANETPAGGLTYFQLVANCDTPGFWQLGFGTQFSRVDVLKTAFMDMRGDPDDARLVQRVGQAVLDWDQRQGTLPRCGGYTCTFPTMTIDQIMAGVSYTHETVDNWWAAVLARDPAISCYILARTLVFFTHDETKGWVGCYYAEPCWQSESDRLGDVLAAWPHLLRAAGLE